MLEHNAIFWVTTGMIRRLNLLGGIKGEQEMPMEIHMIGIALGKTALHLVGLNARDGFVVRKKCWRIQIPRFTANPHFSLIGAKACGGAHFLALALREQGHEKSHRLAIANKHYHCMRSSSNRLPPKQSTTP